MRSSLMLVSTFFVLGGLFSCAKDDDKEKNSERYLAGNWIATHYEMADGSKREALVADTFMLSINSDRDKVQIYDYSLTLPKECQAIKNRLTVEGRSLEVRPSEDNCANSSAQYSASSKNLTLKDARLGDKLVFKSVKLARLNKAQTDKAYDLFKSRLALAESRSDEDQEADQTNAVSTPTPTQKVLVTSDTLEGYWLLSMYTYKDGKNYPFGDEGDETPPSTTLEQEKVIIHFWGAAAHRFVGKRKTTTLYQQWRLKGNEIVTSDVFDLKLNATVRGFSMTVENNINNEALTMTPSFFISDVKHEHYIKIPESSAKFILKDNPDYQEMLKE